MLKTFPVVAEAVWLSQLHPLHHMQKNLTFLNLLKQKGLRTTKLRTALLEILQEAPAPLSVPEMQAALTPAGLVPNKTSLYREVEVLLDSQIANEATISGVRKVYISASGHHHHFVCKNCDRTLCIDDPALEEALTKIEGTIAGQNGVSITQHDLTFYGHCSYCCK